MILKMLKVAKNLLIIFPIFIIFYPFKKVFLFLFYLADMNIWILKNKDKLIIKNSLSLFRDYGKRLHLYEQVKSHFLLHTKHICYIEFGVATGGSFKWWLSHNTNALSRFFGLDTFEGLPEDWGFFYKKGDMASSTPAVQDSRALFIKGLFQDTITDFITHHADAIKNAETIVLHCDADLYSSTIFVLSQMYPYLKKGDIIFFDEFNVPMHEFKAFKEFTENFYIQLKPIAQVNAFYQAAFIVE